MKTSLFDYHLPDDLIAQRAVEPRDSSRLMVIDRNTGQTSHHVFRDIEHFLEPGDCLVVNDTRVLPARLHGKRQATGGKWEGLYLSERNGQWLVMGRTRGKPQPGEIIELQSGDQQTAIDFLLETKTDEGYWWGTPRLNQASSLEILEKVGTIPIPPYIRDGKADDDDQRRYQTVYAQQAGSVAAPTAGLHFTDELVERLKSKGVRWAPVTLHVGLGTFKPVECDDVSQHVMHQEWCTLPSDTLETIKQTKTEGKRVVAVGTTSVRTLESFVDNQGQLTSGTKETSLFIVPGYTFGVVDAMITNFHLPKSTLLMMVSAFVNRKAMLRAYEEAVEKKYRFYSYGDAMFLK